MSDFLILHSFGIITTSHYGGWLVSKIVEQFPKPAIGSPDAGRRIGELERILIYIFVVSGQWSAVGFLVTAKSILRFPEIKDTDGKLDADQTAAYAEYVIIGTLSSFLVAIAVAQLMTSLVESAWLQSL